MTRARRRKVEDRGLRARLRIWALSGAALCAVAVSSAVSTFPLLSGHSEVDQVRHDDLVMQYVADLRGSLSVLQLFVEPHLAPLAPASPGDLAHAAVLAQAVSPGTHLVAAGLAELELTDTARDLEAADAAFSKAFSGLAVLSAGNVNAATSAAVAAERGAYARMWAVTSTAATRLGALRDVDIQQAISFLGHGRATVLAVDAFAALAIAGAGYAFGQRARRRELVERASADRQALESALQQALEMSTDQGAVYGLMDRALREAVPHLQVEMLVADSSRAHFHQTVRAAAPGPDERSGCGVVSPLDCPATIRGHTLVFPTSEALAACPYLQDRPSGPCSATCVSVSIAGKTVGVLHATGADNESPTESDVRYLEVLSRRASERIGMLRAFAKSEAQAHSDPLTGLWNRRSLENRINDLQRDGIPYALAYGDLDHFKALNDTHGHEAGDQALRLFSRVLRDAIRPNDIACRYGGEEFVVVLPECNTETAIGVLERVRERLALALTTGRVPAFTVSFGLASCADADSFAEVVAVADKALLAAKDAGGNRVIVAVPQSGSSSA